MMFGAPGTDAPGPSAPTPAGMGGPGLAHMPKSTMMFGAPEVPSGPGAAVGPVTPSAPANRTMMFGAPGTHAPGPVAQKPSAPANSTMMFGAVAPSAPEPVKPPNSTMMFGAVAPSAPEPAKPANSTMMFGAVAPSAPEPAKPANSTMMFGAVSPSTPSAPKPASTMMFGAVAPSAPDAASARPPSSTLMFGVPSAPPAPASVRAPKLTESTVRLGPDELDRMMREHEAKRGAAATTLPPENAMPHGGQVAAAANRTMMFGAPSAAAEPAPAPKSTQMFGAVPTPASLPKSTQMFGQVNDVPPGGLLSPMPLPNPEAGLGSVELPPEPLMSPHIPMAAQIDDGSGEEMASMLRAQQQRRNRVALIVIAVVLAGAIVAVAAKVLGGSVFSKKVAPELLQASEVGLATLRLDDSASKQKAVATFTELAAKNPDFIEAHAGLVTALALQFDDVQQRFTRLAKAFDERNNRVARYNKERSPSDWQNKAAVLEAEAKAIKEEHDPLVAEATKIDAKVRAAYTALGDAATRAGQLEKSSELALIRAQAIYHAVYKTDQAIPLIQRYDNVAKGQSDGWIDLALAEYAVNAVSSTESKNEALAKLDKLTARDSTFLRAYVLSGRVNLALKKYVDAENDFEKVITMRKEHDVASELAKWSHKLKRDSDGANGP